MFDKRILFSFHSSENQTLRKIGRIEKPVTMGIVKVFFYTLCVIGCSYQLTSIIESYFRYHQTSVSKYFIPQHLKPPTTSFCVPYIDILDIKNMKLRNGIEISKLSKSNQMEILSNILTIRNIFDMTPNSKDLIASCRIRKHNTLMEPLSSEGCYLNFQIQKYFSSNFMCYSIHPHQSEISFLSYTSSVDSPGLIYQIEINATLFGNVSSVKIVISDSIVPLVSAHLARTYIGRHFYSILSKTTLDIIYTKYISKILGFPYDNRPCSNVLREGNCFTRCTTNLSIESFGKLPPNYVTNENIAKYVKSLPISEYKKYTNMDMRLSHIWNKCDGACVWDCTDTYTVTSVLAGVGEHFSLKILSPNTPFLDIVSHPSVTRLDLIVYVTSALGCWFGLAIIDLVKVVPSCRKILPPLLKKFTRKRNVINKPTKIEDRLEERWRMRRNRNMSKMQSLKS